ncbi:hypothetical protein [Flavobacterium sp. UMI-01]|uniref:hypothetical protein n=1 Tax=Flavobacterium sp. UMI-01 TaxID=1441053 RepID=UPI001C7CE745|nr:hypothetical protein [Flavobacterium sp. UMI-01]GIZ07457.1 hypothetical protein FUMI01_01840 [Flavobacterium sp. UMI-01]
MKQKTWSQKEIKNLILEIENKWPVDQWVIDGICIWPYVRLKLYIGFLSNLAVNPNKAEPKDSCNKEFTIKRDLLQIVKEIIVGFFRLQFFFGSLKKKKILFFGAHFHRVIQDSKYFNRFYDAMVEHHNLQDDVYMIEYQWVYDSIYNKKAVITLNKYLDDYKLLIKVLKRFKKIKITRELDQYNEFYQSLILLKLDVKTLNISELDIVNWASKVNSLERFFYRFYSKTKPLKVVFLGYYGYDDLTAAVLAANKLGIKTVDLQHGPQTNIHLAYSNWSKVPQNGYNTMPIEFWNWDNNSKKNIDEWAIKTTNIQSKIIGQPFVSYWLNKVEKLKCNNKCIFYSLQTTPFSIEDMISPEIILLIKNTKFKWILRLHPRSNISIDTLQGYLKLHKIYENVIIQDAFHSPLPEVLSKSVLHITNFSGCLIEAYLMDVPTLLIHKMGQEMFNSYIDEKKVFYLNRESENFELDFFNILKKVETYKRLNNKLEIFNPITESILRA